MTGESECLQEKRANPEEEIPDAPESADPSTMSKSFKQYVNILFPMLEAKAPTKKRMRNGCMPTS